MFGTFGCTLILKPIKLKILELAPACNVFEPQWPYTIMSCNDILAYFVFFIFIVLERKISTRQTREELIKKGVLIPDQGEIRNKLWKYDTDTSMSSAAVVQY